MLNFFVILIISLNIQGSMNWLKITMKEWIKILIKNYDRKNISNGVS